MDSCGVVRWSYAKICENCVVHRTVLFLSWHCFPRNRTVREAHEKLEDIHPIKTPWKIY